MGTRNMIAVVVDGEHRIAQYGQWDGYPAGQGVGILDFLHNGNVNALKANALKCKFISDEEYIKLWEEFGVSKEDRFVSFDTANAFSAKYPQLSRDTGSEILQMVAASKNGLLLRDSYDFAADSLFCEWAYVIDFDKNSFEVYEGFNKEPLDKSERFADMEPDDGYYPVKLRKEFDLSKLPTREEFLATFEKPTNDNA